MPEAASTFVSSWSIANSPYLAAHPAWEVVMTAIRVIS